MENGREKRLHEAEAGVTLDIKPITPYLLHSVPIPIGFRNMVSIKVSDMNVFLGKIPSMQTAHASSGRSLYNMMQPRIRDKRSQNGIPHIGHAIIYTSK
ncbi:hypothetical protein VTN96DRAFT_8106 [Rasamsonia emersonii]